MHPMRLSILLLAIVTLGQPWMGRAWSAEEAVEKTLTVDGRQREYRVFVPSGHKGPLPVVFMLHGGGGNARGIERITRFDELAEEEGFIVVYPQGFDSHWNDGRGVAFMRAQKENVDDVKFIRAVLDDVAAGNAVDRGRVFATGISNGGFMVHRLAADAADMVAAIAPVVGGLAPAIGEKFNPRQPVSILIIQGDADPIVPIDGGDVVIGNGPSRGKVLPTKETLAKYLARDGNRTDAVAPVVASGPRQGTSVEEFKYPDGPCGVKTYYYIVKQGGHTWYGEGRVASSTPTRLKASKPPTRPGISSRPAHRASR